jgi:CHAT domain-containing protein
LRALAGILLSQCQHITLSSCWSADNFIVPGRWIISLPETLWRSGAGGVLGSLWAADDDVAAAFTERFYAELERMPRDVALRKVQLACIANQLGCRRAGSALIDTSTPEFWAGFVLYGDTARLKM